MAIWVDCLKRMVVEWLTCSDPGRVTNFTAAIGDGDVHGADLEKKEPAA